MNAIPFSQLTPHQQNQHMVAQLDAIKQIATPDRFANIVINLNSDGLINIASSITDAEEIRKILINVVQQYFNCTHRTIRPNEQN